MDEAKVAQVAELFDRALDVPRHEREKFIADISGGDAELIDELRSLLEAHDSSTGFFEELAQAAVSPGYDAVLASKAKQDLATLIPDLEAALQGRYKIESELAGGMSRVFLASEIRLGRKVVIKVLSGDVPATMSAERFRREIQTAAGLQHPHIVPLLTTDSTDRLLYYTMPFVAGESLRSRLTREGSLPVRDAVSIWRDVLDALAYAHERGIVHCDIKPGNILLSGRNALVTDFGIARAFEAAAGDAEVTTPGLVIGTPAYMAPEQVAAKVAADNRADIYAAGLVMYEMLDGRLPFSGTSTRELLQARMTGKPAPIAREDCPDDLAELVLRCLATDRAQRPSSAEELLTALEALDVDAAPRKRSRRFSIIGYSAMALVLATVLFAVMRLKDNKREPGSAAGGSNPSIAVLPVSNLSRDSADAAFADGMTEELRGMLSGTGKLRVIGSTSVIALRDRHLTSKQIADSLGVSHFLEGSLQKVGTRVRMHFRLIDAADGSTRWSETYDRQLADVFEVQDNISRAVVSELNIQLGAGATRAAHQRFTPNIAAYESYLRGASMLARNDAERKQAISYFEQAIAADSNFAGAYARLAWEYLYAGGTQPGDHILWYNRAESAARKSIRLDSSLAEGHSALGWALYAKGDWTGAETELQRAVAMDPGVHRGDEGLARIYMVTGRPAKQLAAAQRALEVDPYSVQALREMGLALNMNGRCDETIPLLAPLKALKPPASVAGVIIGECYIKKQMWPQAIAEFRWAMETADAKMALAFLGYSLARSGQTAEAHKILDDLLAGRRNSHGAFGIAVIYAGLRDYDQAFAWLHKAIQERSLRIYIMDPIFFDLQKDPRFSEVRSYGGS